MPYLNLIYSRENRHRARKNDFKHEIVTAVGVLAGGKRKISTLRQAITFLKENDAAIGLLITDVLNHIAKFSNSRFGKTAAEQHRYFLLRVDEWSTFCTHVSAANVHRNAYRMQELNYPDTDALRIPSIDPGDRAYRAAAIIYNIELLLQRPMIQTDNSWSCKEARKTITHFANRIAHNYFCQLEREIVYFAFCNKDIAANYGPKHEAMAAGLKEIFPNIQRTDRAWLRWVSEFQKRGSPVDFDVTFKPPSIKRIRTKKLANN